MPPITNHGQVLHSKFPFKGFSRDIWLICLSNIIGAFGEGLYFWGFPIYVRTLQADYVQLGLIFSALYGVAALVPLPGGLLADRFDRKKILILSWTPWIFAPLIYSFADNWTQLIPGTICWGASMLGLPAITAYVITSVNDRERLASALALVWSSYSLSYVFAPTVGAYLTTTLDMRFVLRISSLLAAVSTGIFLLLRNQHPQKRDAADKEEPETVKNRRKLFRRLLLWAAISALASCFISIARPYVPTFLDEQTTLTEFQIGLFGSVNYAGITLLGMSLGRLGDRWRKSGAIGISMLFYVVSVVPMLLIRGPIPLMFVAFILGGSATGTALASSYVGTIAPQKKQGFWLSIPQTAGLLAAFAAPYLGGFLYTISPYHAFIVSVSGLPLIAIFAFTKLKE